MTVKGYKILGRATALTSFLIGSAIFGMYYQTSDSNLLFIGYGFIVLVGLINIAIVIAILLRARNESTRRRDLYSTCGVMLLNIPVMLIYCWIAVILLGTMRITFTNQMGTKISDINIVGCGGGHIKELEIGESATTWIDITGDCSIEISYLADGERRIEQVASYVTSNMGQKVDHKIDGQDKDIL